MGRYDDRTIAINNNELYKDTLKKKGVNIIKQYVTPNLKHLSSSEFSQLNKVGHIWKQGDSFAKLAYQYYSDATLWWVIAWTNQVVLEADIAPGNTIYICLPRDKVLKLLNV